MNKFVILILVLVLVYIRLGSIQTANSLPFAGSYLLRAKGSEALYWNPATLNSNFQDLILPACNQTFHIANSAFDLDTYNFISGRYLNENDKRKIMNNIGNSLVIDANANVILIGKTFGNIAFASGAYGMGRTKISKEYIRLLLYGNEETDYVFRKKDNQLSALSYQDFTAGFGNLEISRYLNNEKIPDIYMGMSFSALAGYIVAETEYYYGSFHSDIDGMSFQQDIHAKTGKGGIGFKSLIGLRSQPIENLDVGLSIDNLLGRIRWVGDKERYYYSVSADSVYAADISEDLFVQEKSSESIRSFTTKIPLELRLGAMYTYKNANVSIDWVQGLANSQLTSSIGTTSIGAEYIINKRFPVKTGIKLGNAEFPYSISYGIGYFGKFIELGIGIQTFESVLPGYYSKGISFASSFTLHN
ncbi:MAG: hypothetical protein FJ041_00505 [Candidatus Cloacimonetes bacterium]|nr:hypothetical protein [Candidatus Cloacimonadota bacterium]